jgi:hypothetical protein
MYRVSLYLLLAISLNACQSDPISSDGDSRLVPDDLQPYFSSFEDAAADLGVPIDIAASGITAEIRAINQGNVAGTCSTNGFEIRHITIDRSFWTTASPLLREMVVYHELGHCILGRGHTETSFANGLCTSIMRSGLGDCHDAYNFDNRSYYLRELFGLL